MSREVVECYDASNAERVLALLGRSPVESAWAIQDLSRFGDATKFYFVDEGRTLSYLLISGHPSTRRGAPTVVLGGRPETVERLLEAHLPSGPWIMRETSATLAPIVQRAAPHAVVYEMRRMQATRTSLRLRSASARTRRLGEADATALADFFGDSSGSGHGYTQWLRAGFVYGAFDQEAIAAIATAIVRSPDAWILVGIETRKDLRGRGFGTAVTASISDAALEQTKAVSLTVATDNAAAIAVYRKLGFSDCDLRVWVDNGTGIGP